LAGDFRESPLKMNAGLGRSIECWSDWRKGRRANAIAALAAIRHREKRVKLLRKSKKFKTVRKASKHRPFSRLMAFKTDTFAN
jgi:hypothetical protein